MIAKCSIGEIGEILGVNPENIRGLRVQASGVVAVRCKKTEDKEAVMRTISQEKVESMMKKESRTGVIVYGIDRKYEKTRGVAPASQRGKSADQGHGGGCETVWVVPTEVLTELSQDPGDDFGEGRSHSPAWVGGMAECPRLEGFVASHRLFGTDDSGFATSELQR